jgi:hypothetical protein
MSKQVYEEAKPFIMGNLKGYFLSLKGDFGRLKDARTKRLRDSIGKENWEALRLNYNNSNLNEMVLRSGAKRTTIDSGERIIAFSNPGFTIPASKIGRAHFYAPVKVLGNTMVETFLFNLVVLWILSIILYILLYFKVLARVIKGFENLRFQKAEV